MLLGVPSGPFPGSTNFQNTIDWLAPSCICHPPWQGQEEERGEGNEPGRRREQVIPRNCATSTPSVLQPLCDHSLTPTQLLPSSWPCQMQREQGQRARPASFLPPWGGHLASLHGASSCLSQCGHLCYPLLRLPLHLCFWLLPHSLQTYSKLLLLKLSFFTNPFLLP